MGIFSTVFKPITNIIDGVLDKTITDKNLRQKLRHDIEMAIMDQGRDLVKNATAIIVAETQGGLLQRNWRPVTMLVFVGLVVCRWLGLTDHSISEAVELELMALIKIGIGGYVMGRSAEKVAKVWKEN